jgi:hypothetical protein
VGRTRSPEVAKRNDSIYAEWLRGASLTLLGERYSLSRQVVGRIVAAQHPEGPEDEDRALYRGYMWRLYDEVQVIGDNPGYKMQPNGKTATDLDGEPALDAGVQVQAKELQLKILRELRLLDARDKPQQRQLTIAHEIATSQAAADIAVKRAEMEAWARRGGQPVVPGEVVRELPPGQAEAS